MLNVLFSPLKAVEQISRALPSWGRSEVGKAAEFYKATIEWPKLEPSPADVVF